MVGDLTEQQGRMTVELAADPVAEAAGPAPQVGIVAEPHTWAGVDTWVERHTSAAWASEPSLAVDKRVAAAGTEGIQAGR